MKNKQKLLAATVFAVLTAAAPLVPAQSASGAEPPAPYPRGYGPGMMGGYGPGQGGYGPGMMGGYGPQGRGMMGGYGPGPGYGQGYGPGMMGGYGRGGMMGGMMGLGALQALDLSEQQLGKINQIRDEARRRNWDAMGKLLDEQARLRDLFAAEKRDPAAIGKQSMKVADLRRQLLEASIDSHNRIEALLSKEQKDQLRSQRRGWMLGDD